VKKQQKSEVETLSSQKVKLFFNADVFQKLKNE